jgi:hypothetical protein
MLDYSFFLYFLYFWLAEAPSQVIYSRRADKKLHSEFACNLCIYVFFFSLSLSFPLLLLLPSLTLSCWGWDPGPCTCQGSMTLS